MRAKAMIGAMPKAKGALDWKKGAPECVKDCKRHGNTKKNEVKPPQINTLSHRVDNTGVEDG